MVSSSSLVAQRLVPRTAKIWKMTRLFIAQKEPCFLWGRGFGQDGCFALKAQRWRLNVAFTGIDRGFFFFFF
jgi:hypothetical protein